MSEYKAISAIMPVRSSQSRRHILVGHKDLEAAHNLSERNGSIILPVLYRLYIVNKNDKIFVLPLIVNLRLDGISTRHGEDISLICDLAETI